MAQRSKATFQKREREKDKQQKQRDKEVRRMEAKKAKAEREPIGSHEDPDIAGIKPGPQPLPEQWQYAVRQNGK
jgi:hypothetical protein